MEKRYPLHISREVLRKSTAVAQLHVNRNLNKTIWKQIISETEAMNSILEEYMILDQEEASPLNPAMQYMETKLLHILRTALEDTLYEAVNTDNLIRQKGIFNGLDYLAELLWNRNPMYPKRHMKYVYIHDIDWTKELLQNHPRPYFPLSWIYTREIAVKIIQRAIRAYLVRKREDIQEMRQFWKILKKEAGIDYVSVGKISIQSDHSGSCKDNT